jgi:hypothetical protein
MSRKIPIISLITLLALLSCSFTISGHRAQGSQAGVNIKVWDHRGKEPVKIVDLYLGGQLLKSGEDFQAGKDWLGGLTVRVKNVSDQPVKEVILFLEMDTGTKGPHGLQLDKRVRIPYGRSYYYSRNANVGQDIVIPPGGTAMISYNSNLIQALRDGSYTLPNRGKIFVATVVFGDLDHGWTGGTYISRDPTGRWAVDQSKVSLNLRPDPKRNSPKGFLAKGQEMPLQ